ncbi:HD domain-containing protein [bacterium]|nr:HD domain-containing protein [bacterium]
MANTTSPFGLREEDLIAIPVEALKPNTPINFDLYASVGGSKGPNPRPSDIVLFASAPSNWNNTEPAVLKKCGISSFFIRQADHARYKSYLAFNSAQRSVDRNGTPEFRISQIQDIGSHLMEVCFHTGMDHLVLDRLQTVADDIVTCLEDDPRAVRHIQNLVDHDMYTYFHSTGVGILSVAMAKAMGENNAEVLRGFALGGLLHDIGKRLTPLHVLNKSGPLLDSEWELMKRHPEDGFEAVKNLEVPQMVRDIILYHHEKRDGSGYPHRLTADKIPLPAQLVSIADIFNALTTTRSYHKKRSRFEALMLMKHDMNGKLWSDGFKALIAALTDGENKDSEELRAICV